MKEPGKTPSIPANAENGQYPLLDFPGWYAILEENLDMDAASFALRHSDKKGMPVRALAEQIHCYPRAKAKLGPFHLPGMIYLQEALEQSSGYAVATWRAGRFNRPVIADMTGGLGVDTAAWASAGSLVYYCEKNGNLAAVARHNHELMGLPGRIFYHCGDAESLIAGNWNEGKWHAGKAPVNKPPKLLDQEAGDNTDASHYDGTGEKSAKDELSGKEFPEEKLPQPDLLYLDPSRRVNGRRMYAIDECEPAVLELLPLMRRIAPEFLIKLSPMIDLQELVRLIPECRWIGVVSCDGEVREVLAYGAFGPGSPDDEPVIREAVILNKNGTVQHRFRSNEPLVNGPSGDRQQNDPSKQTASGRTLSESAKGMNTEATEGTTDTSGRGIADTSAKGTTVKPEAGMWLFVPDPALVKADMLNRCCERYGLNRMHHKSGYLIGETPVSDFPGKCHQIDYVLDYKPRLIRNWLPGHDLEKVHIHVNSFPMSVEQLYRTLDCQMGEKGHLFFTRTHDSSNIMLVSRKRKSL